MDEPDSSTFFQIVEEVLKNGNSNPDSLQKLENFSNDFTNFEKCKEILETADNSEYVQIFASQTLIKLTELNISNWKIDFSLKLCDWSISYMLKNSLEVEKVILSYLSDLVAIMLEHFWNSSKENHHICMEEWNAIIQILGNEPNEWAPGLLLINSIHDKLLKSKDNAVVELFLKDCLSSCFIYAFDAAKRIRNSNIPNFEFPLEISLNIIEKCLYDRKKCEISGLIYEEQINFYFELYDNFQLFRSLNCLYAVVTSIDKLNSSYPKLIEQLCAGFFGLLNDKMEQIEQIDEEHLHFILTILSEIAMHLRFSVIQQMEIDENLFDFFSMMKEFTLILFQQIQDHEISTVENAISFWAKIEKALRNDGNVEPKKIIASFAPELCENYINYLLNAQSFNKCKYPESPSKRRMSLTETNESNTGFEDILEIMEGKLSQLIFPIQSFVFLNHEDICPHLLRELKKKQEDLISSFESSNDEVIANEFQLSFFVEVAIVILLIKKSGARLDPKIKFHVDFFAELISLLRISEEWTSNGILLPRLEMSLIMFISNFKKTLFGCVDPKSSPTTNNLYVQLKRKRVISSYKECRIFFFDRVIFTLQSFNEQRILSQAISIIHNNDSNLIPSRKTLDAIFNNPFDQTFHFLNIFENKSLRSNFFSTMFSIINNLNENDFPNFLSLLLEMLDSKFESVSDDCIAENEETKKDICFLAIDICGIFNEAKDRSSFNPIFDWFTSDDRPIQHAKIFETTVSSILSNSIECENEDDDFLINSILEMWKSISLCTPRTRILFDFSSANGLILFKKAAIILIQYYNFIEQFENNHELSNTKISGIEYSFLMFQNLVSGNYVPFEAFKIYNDPIFINLLASMTKMINESFLKTIEEYPSTFTSMCILFKDLMINQIDTLLETSQQLFLIVLDYSIKILVNDNSELHQCSLDTVLSFLRHIYEFDLDFKPFQSQIDGINFALWNKILREGTKVDSNIIEILKLLYLLNDQSLTAIKDKISQNLSKHKNALLEDNFKSLEERILSDDSKNDILIQSINNIIDIMPPFFHVFYV